MEQTCRETNIIEENKPCAIKTINQPLSIQTFIIIFKLYKWINFLFITLIQFATFLIPNTQHNHHN